MDNKHQPLSRKEEYIATKIVDAAYTVHKALVPCPESSF